MGVFEKIKREILKRPDNKFSGILFAACVEIEAEHNERAKHEKAKYDFNRDPGFIVCGND
jgi:hypothetical protein